MFILVACSNNNRDNATNSDEVSASTQLSEDKPTQIDNLEKQIAELQTDLNYKKEAADYYKQLIDDLIKGYSNAQLKDLAITLWDYELAVNGVNVPSNGIVEIHESAIEISLMERQPAYLVLPNEIFMQGQINGNYTEHITMNSKPAETYVTDGTVVTGIHHKFVGVEEGSTISLTITEDLKKRLGLETTQITINNR